MKSDKEALAKPDFIREPQSIIDVDGKPVHVFDISTEDGNMDKETVGAFEKEWSRFDAFQESDLASIGAEYFDLVNDAHVNPGSIVLDLGCGSGRWSKYLADRAAWIEAVDPGDSVLVAARMLNADKHIRISKAEVSQLPFANDTFDFIFSLGVLHHVPDTSGAIRVCFNKLKPSGWLLLYLHYRFDNRGPLFRVLFGASDLLRKVICKLPYRIKHACTDAIAVLVYLPLVLFARIVKFLFPKQGYYKSLPLSYYVNKRFFIMRNDALDRFGTPLEKRFTRSEINAMLLDCGFTNIRFSPHPPYWHVIAQKEA